MATSGHSIRLREDLLALHRQRPWAVHCELGRGSYARRGQRCKGMPLYELAYVYEKEGRQVLRTARACLEHAKEFAQRYALELEEQRELSLEVPAPRVKRGE